MVLAAEEVAPRSVPGRDCDVRRRRRPQGARTFVLLVVLQLVGSHHVHQHQNLGGLHVHGRQRFLQARDDRRLADRTGGGIAEKHVSRLK